MANRNERRILWYVGGAALLAGSLLFAIGVKVGCDLYQAHENQCADECYSVIPRTAGLIFDWIGRHVNVISTAITAFGTVLIGYFTFTLWRSTREQLRHVCATERAFVFVRDFKKVAKLAFDGQPRAWRLNPIWENSGTTPTRRMVAHVSIKFFEGEIPESFDFPDQFGDAGDEHESPIEPVPTFIGARAQTIGGAVVANWDGLTRVWKGEQRALIWGWADYNDIFEGTVRHRTEFCYEIFVMGNPKAPDPSHIGLRAYKKHNGADDECLRQPGP